MRGRLPIPIPILPSPRQQQQCPKGPIHLRQRRPDGLLGLHSDGGLLVMPSMLMGR